MPKRKTFSIAKLLHKVNSMNRLSTCSSEVRQGWNSLLADVLHESGVYAGYNYLGPEDIPTGQRPGIAFETACGVSLTPIEFFERLDAHEASKAQFLKGEEVHPPNGDHRVFPDESRRFYYVDASLLKAYAEIPSKG